MADPDGNPTEPTDPRYERPSPIKSVAPAPRVNPPNINTAREAPVPLGAPGYGDFLEWMRVQLGGETTASTEGQRTLIPKEKKKFQRRDAESKADQAIAPPEEDDGPTTHPATPGYDLPESNPTARISPGDAGVQTPRVRRGQKKIVKRNLWVGVLIQVAALALLAGSFLLGRASVTRPAPPPMAPAAPEVLNQDGKVTTKLLSSANSTLIDQAMAAEQVCDFKKAGELLQQIKASGEHVHGLAFQIAQLAVFADGKQKIQLLNEALNSGEELSSTYRQRAMLNVHTRAYRNAAMNDYETATKIDPFDARNFFYWGESLRRDGKPQAALVRLRQALHRLREPTAAGFYRLAIRLTQIELGQEQEFADELNKQMALPDPGMDWLFTAAALKLREGKSVDAAALIARADGLGDPEAFAMRLNDYYISQHGFDKELKPFYDRARSGKPGAISPQPSPAESAPPDVGLDVPTLPPPAATEPTGPR